MARNGPVMSANIPAIKSYDNFPLRSAPIEKPNYTSKHEIPTYKAGGEVVRPKSVIKGRRLRTNYDTIKTPSHPDFYPIYGPQGEKRMPTYGEREKAPKERVVKPPKEKPPREEPRTYYKNEPEIQEKYRSKPIQREEKRREYPERNIQEKPVRQDEKKQPEIEDPYQSKLKKRAEEPNRADERRPAPRQEREVIQRRDEDKEERPLFKDKERPENRNGRLDPVIVHPYQSNLKKKPEEAKIIKQTEEQKPQPKQEIRRDDDKEERPVYKENEKPQTKNARVEPIIIDPYQSKLKKKIDETDKNKKREEPKPKQEEEVIREPVYDIKKDPEKPDSTRDRKEPVITDLYQSKLRKKQDEPVKEEKLKPKEEKTEPKQEEKLIREPVYEVTKDPEKPDSRRDRKEPVITELYQSKLRKKQEPVKEKKPKPKEEKIEPKLEEKKEDKENIPQEENDDYLGYKDEETPIKKATKDPIIIDLYRSKLKVRTPNIKKEEKTKPDPKKEEIIVLKEEPQEKIVHQEEDKKPEKEKPKKEKPKKEKPKKEKPKKIDTETKTKKPDPYNYTLYDDVKTEPRVETKKVDKYTQEPEDGFKIQDDDMLAPTKKPERPDKKAKEPPKKEVYDEDELDVTPQRAKFRGRDRQTVRAKYYEQADMDDVLRDKIATQLRENGVSETKVVPLSAKITQAVRDDVIDSNNQATPHVTENLKEVINKHLDPILYNKPNTTDLKDYQKPSDAKHLSNLVLLRVGQVHEEAELCKKTADDATRKGGKGYSPREDHSDRSMILAIKDSLKKQKTDNDILRDKLKQAHRDTHDVADDKDKKQEVLQSLDSDNWKLKRDLNEADQDKHSLLAKVKEQQKNYHRLDKQQQGLRHENGKLKDRLIDSETRTHNMSTDLLKLQSENARLKVLADQKEKEILHLRDPDQEMIHQMKILSDEVTLLRTQTRRLNEEKGMLKSRSQKLESSLEESFKQKSKISVERENLERENEALKQRYRKLSLANPQQRMLPDINGGRNGPSSRTNSRSTPRAHSRSVPNNDDRRLSTAREADEDSNY